MLAGEADFIAKAKVWTRRAGGNLISFYPYILAARQGLEDNLPGIAGAVDYARKLGPLLADLPGVHANPATPQAAMFHLHVNVAGSRLIRAIDDYAEQHDVIVLPKPRATDECGNAVCEISVGRSTMSHPPRFWLAHLRRCLTSCMSDQVSLAP